MIHSYHREMARKWKFEGHEGCFADLTHDLALMAYPDIPPISKEVRKQLKRTRDALLVAAIEVKKLDDVGEPDERIVGTILQYDRTQPQQLGQEDRLLLNLVSSADYLSGLIDESKRTVGRPSIPIPIEVPREIQRFWRVHRPEESDGRSFKRPTTQPMNAHSKFQLAVLRIIIPFGTVSPSECDTLMRKAGIRRAERKPQKPMP